MPGPPWGASYPVPQHHRPPAATRPAAYQQQAQLPSPAARPRTRQPSAPARKKSGGGWVMVFVILLFLILSGTGRELLDVIADFLNQ